MEKNTAIKQNEELIDKVIEVLVKKRGGIHAAMDKNKKADLRITLIK